MKLKKVLLTGLAIAAASLTSFGSALMADGDVYVCVEKGGILYCKKA